MKARHAILSRQSLCIRPRTPIIISGFDSVLRFCDVTVGFSPWGTFRFESAGDQKFELFCLGQTYSFEVVGGVRLWFVGFQKLVGRTPIQTSWS